MNQNNSQNNEKTSVYAIVTERIINALKTGVVPWNSPWVKMPAPRNFLSNAAYRGVNHLLLRLAERSTCFWLTRSQVELRGGTIKAGERGQVITFWKASDKLPDTATQEEKDKARSVLRYYRVFNYDQTEGLPPLPEAPKVELLPYSAAEEVIEKMPQRPTITRDGDEAYYSVTRDTINIPSMDRFTNLDGYYSIWFHELAHSTRHSHRLDRRYKNENPDQPRVYGTTDYSREELVAELTAAFLCSELGLENFIECNAAYIAGWLSALQDDEKLIVHAAAMAQKAADFIAGRLHKSEPLPVIEAQPKAVVPQTPPQKKTKRSKRMAAEAAA